MQRKEKKKQFRGMTLIELMVVVAIIGILSSIALPRLSRVLESSKQAEASGVLTRLFKAYRELTNIDELMVFGTDTIIDMKDCSPPGGTGDQFNFIIDFSGGSVDRRRCSFYHLGFDENLNENSDFDFTYIYYDVNDHCNLGSCNSEVPDMLPKFCAIRKRPGVDIPSNDGELDYDKYICILCTNGTIYKGSEYR